MNYSKISDRQMYRLCKKWGAAVLEARRKFAGLLPEVAKRRLYERRGYGSIYHFAAKLAGMSREQVDMVLRLGRRLEDKPVLRRALTEGQISVNKLARVISIATVENHRELAEKIATLSQAAVEAFVQDYKNENGLRKPLGGCESLRAQTGPGGAGGGDRTLRLDADVERQLLEMQAKGIDINAFLRGALETRRCEIAEEKEMLAQEQAGGGGLFSEGKSGSAVFKPVSRYVPVKIRRILREEYGTQCSVPGCAKTAVNLHHEQGFAKIPGHDPRFLKPLCVGHHQLAHAGDPWVQRFRNLG